MTPVFIGGCSLSGATLLTKLLGAHSRCVRAPEPLEGPDDREGVVRLIDRSPFDRRLGATLQELPTARLVHMVRDGRGVAASALPPGRGPRTITRAASWWVEALAHGLALESRGGPGRALRIRYEDLVLDPEHTLRRVTEFLGLDDEPRMLSGDTSLEPGRADAWSDALTARQIEIFESLTGDLLTYLGYPLRFGVRARPASLAERLVAVVADPWRARLRARRRAWSSATATPDERASSAG